MKLFFGSAELPKGRGKEYKEKDYKDKDCHEHDSYANPLEQAANVPGQDVVDPENYHNIPGFEDREVYNGVIDESRVGGEVGELMEKYGLEEWELRDLMKKSYDYLNRGKNQKIVPPFKDVNQTIELGNLYRDYLMTQNEFGLPWSEEELSELAPGEVDTLGELYGERRFLSHQIALLNEEPKERKEKSVVYSTSRSGGREKPGLLSDLEDVNKKIAKIERHITGYEESRTEKKMKVDKEDSWREVPKYSAEELALKKSCLEYFKNRHQPRPKFVDGQELSEAQILEVVQETAREECWPRGGFFAESFKGRRQLSRIEYHPGAKKGEQMRTKYVFLSDNLPAGSYFFQPDADRFFVDRKNPNSAIAPIKLMVSSENPDDFLAKKEQMKSAKKASA